jgi:cystathionine beta-lyase/cystathionine gamma-synthase
MGTPGGLVRYSVGVEDVEGLTADFSQALESA